MTPSTPLCVAFVEAVVTAQRRTPPACRHAFEEQQRRRKQGKSVAHIALRRYLSGRDSRVAEVVELARALDVLGPVRAAVDVLQAS